MTRFKAGAIFAVLAMSAAALAASPARADFVFANDINGVVPGNTPVAASVNMSQTATILAGHTFYGTSGSVKIDFMANVNVSTANGAASIDGIKTKGTITPINTLWITPENGTAFNEFSFRGALHTNADQFITVTITDQHGSVFDFKITDNGDFSPIGFEAKKGTGELIKSVEIQGQGLGFDDFKQMGFGLYPDAVTAVPEASTWAMMLFGFVSVGFVAYRKKAGAADLRLV